MTSSIIPDAYEGREQALVKHVLLKSYLEKLVLIIGMSARKARRAEICFVDCFAGPWGAPSDDLEGTSISLSLKTLAACKEKLLTLGVDATMRALYIEKDKVAFEKLSAFLVSKAPPAVEHACLRGDFVDLRGDILKWCGVGAFTFFFVDPKGWKDIGIEVMRPLLQRPRSEFLINFAYNFINRTASMAAWQDAMVRLLGASVNLEGLQSAEREEALVNAYRSNLKACVHSNRPEYRARSAYVTVLDPLHQRTKYHLVYLTCHPQGIVEFMDMSERVDLVQRRVRTAKKIDVRQQKTGVMDMFGIDPQTDPADGRCSHDKVDAFWRSYLAHGERRIGTAEFADILESTDWLPGDLQSSLVRLVRAGVVQNLDADASKRRSKPLHFDKAERLRLHTTIATDPRRLTASQRETYIADALNNARQIASTLPKGAEMVNVYAQLLSHIVRTDYCGGCHDTAAVLHMLFGEIGVASILCIGEVGVGAKFFDHSWVEVEGRIFDAAVCMPSLAGQFVGGPVFASIDLVANAPTTLRYGEKSGEGLGHEALAVLPLNLSEYSAIQPDANIWMLVVAMASQSGMVDPRFALFQQRYGHVRRTPRL